MIRRFMDVVIHPSKIGYYHKNNVIIPVLYLLAFMSAILGIIAGLTYTSTYFTTNTGDNIVDGMMKSTKTPEITYNEYKMEGTVYTITLSDYHASYLEENYNPNKYSSIINMNFKAEECDVYFGTSKVKTIKYSDLKENYTFDMRNIKGSNSTDRKDYVSFMNSFFYEIELDYKTDVYLSFLQRILFYFAISIAAAFVFSYFTNGELPLSKRIVLVLYDMVSYFIVMFFSIAFNISILQYVAIAVPVLYSELTFRHIRKKGSSN